MSVLIRNATILTMNDALDIVTGAVSVHETDVVSERLEGFGLRAVVGKCMMDSDRDVPTRLQERTQESIDESVALRKRWDGKGNGRLHAAFAPRFAVSCSRALLEAV